MPSSRCSSVLERFSFCSPSSSSLRETTILPRFLFSLMTATSMRLALHSVEIADRTQIDLRAGQEGVRADDVDSEAALDAVNHHRLDRLLLVVGLLDFFPGVNALRLLVREVDVAFFGLSLVAHDVNFVAGLELGLALVVEHFGQRQHAFRLGADIDDDVRRRQLEHRALDDAVFADGLFGLGGEASRAQRRNPRRRLVSRRQPGRLRGVSAGAVRLAPVRLGLVAPR